MQTHICHKSKPEGKKKDLTLVLVVPANIFQPKLNRNLRNDTFVCLQLNQLSGVSRLRPKSRHCQVEEEVLLQREPRRVNLQAWCIQLQLSFVDQALVEAAVISTAQGSASPGVAVKKWAT